MITYEDHTHADITITVRKGTYGYAGFVAELSGLEKPVSSLKVLVQYTGAKGAMTVDRISLKTTGVPQRAGEKTLTSPDALPSMKGMQ
jgi:hypothetical protein